MLKCKRRLASCAALASLALFCAFVAASDAQTLRAARAQTSPPHFARTRATLNGHTGDIVEIVFSPDGGMLATGAEDGTVRLWDAETGALKATLKLTKSLDSVAIRWSPDGALLATKWTKELSSNIDHLQVWDATTGELCASLAGHRWDVNTFEWSADSRRIVTASEDGTARVWDARTGKVLTEIVFEQLNTDKYTESFLKATFTTKHLPEYFSISARFTADGQNILVSSTAKPPQLYTAAGQPVAAPLALPKPQTWMSPLTSKMNPLSSKSSSSSFVYFPLPLVSPDARLVVTPGSDGVRVWDAATGERRFTLLGAGSDCYFSPDGRTLLTTWRHDPFKWTEDAASLKLWDARTGEVLRSYDKLPAPYNVVWSPDGNKVLLVGYAKAKTRILSLRTGEVVARLPWEGCDPDSFFGDGACDPFIFNADGRITLKLKGELKLFNADTGALLAALPDTNRRAAFHPTDPRLLAARSRDKRSIYLFDLELK
jgi:WD40 repeat protein